MSFITKIKSFAKSNWTFGALVVVPVLRVLWRAFVGDKKTPNPLRPTPITGDTYKKGDVIDVEIRK